MRRKPPNRTIETVIQDERGRILGRARVINHDLLRDDIKLIRDFLIGLKQEKFLQTGVTTMAEGKPQPTVNQVKLAGTLKMDPQKYDNATRALVETGQKQAIPIMASVKDEKLYDLLQAFKQGDYIQVVALIEPYGIKDEQTGKWKNGVNIRLTQIVNTPPVRPRPEQQRMIADDDIPF